MSDPAQRFFDAERLRRAGELARAEVAYCALLDAAPRHAGGLEGLAAIHEAAERAEDAARCRAEAGRIRAEAAAEVAAALLFANDIERARQCCAQALAHDADCLKAHWLLGDMAARADDRAAALAHYRRCREIAPDRPGPGFLMAALGDGAVPERAPADYVTAQFDRYADTFDRHLVDMLLYRGPAEIARVLRPLVAGTAPAILDLGCGTGLLAPEVADFAGELVGVDLSPAMLAKAVARGAYDALVAAEIVDFLATRPAGAADVVAAVDVFVYFGDLEAVFAGAARTLRRGGFFAFTTERWNDEDVQDPPAGRAWRLRANGRYQHARPALCALAAAQGFAIVSLEDRVLRYELGLPVDSDIALLRRRA